MTEEMIPYSNAKGKLNIDPEDLLNQVERNLGRQWQQIQVHPEQETEILIVGGGPSTKLHLDEIRKLKEEGGKVVALNGSFNYLLDEGITPTAFVMLDGREFNTRFVERASEAPECKFFIAGQCNEKVFDILEQSVPIENRFMFHCFGRFKDHEHPMVMEKMLDAYYFGNAGYTYYVVIGGSTVALRAMWLMRMLGFYKQHLFGVDSCIYDHTHHVYPQAENDRDEVQRITCADRQFWCTNWMASQAKEFIDFVKAVGDQVELNIHGDGLLAWIIEKGAEAFVEEEE